MDNCIVGRFLSHSVYLKCTCFCTEVITEECISSASTVSRSTVTNVFRKEYTTTPTSAAL